MDDKIKNKSESMKGLFNSLSKINLFKKISFLSKLNFKHAKANIIYKIKGLRKDTRIAERVWKIVELSRNEDRPKQLIILKIFLRTFRNCQVTGFHLMTKQ